jgi:hypothetical protein
MLGFWHLLRAWREAYGVTLQAFNSEETSGSAGSKEAGKPFQASQEL